MRYKITTAPAKEPLTLTEAKLFLRVDTSVDDDLINSLIATARDYCQQYEGRAYVEQTITAYFDKFSDTMFLPLPPLLSVESVEYRDANDDWQTLDEAYYSVHIATDPGYIEFSIDGVSLSVKSVDNSVRIIFTAGYTYDDSGDWLGSVPDRIKAAISLLVGHWYERRLATCADQLHEIPMGVKSLLSERSWQNAE